MAKYRRSRNNKIEGKKKVIIMVLAGFLAVVGLIIAFIKKIPFLQKFNKDSQEFGSENEKFAAIIAEKLGTIYPVYDPRHWSEDDEGVIEIVLQQSGNYEGIAAAYYTLTGRRLSEDIVKYVDDITPIANVI